MKQSCEVQCTCLLTLVITSFKLKKPFIYGLYHELYKNIQISSDNLVQWLFKKRLKNRVRIQDAGRWHSSKIVFKMEN